MLWQVLQSCLDGASYTDEAVRSCFLYSITDAT